MKNQTKNSLKLVGILSAAVLIAVLATLTLGINQAQAYSHHPYTPKITFSHIEDHKVAEFEQHSLNGVTVTLRNPYRDDFYFEGGALHLCQKRRGCTIEIEPCKMAFEGVKVECATGGWPLEIEFREKVYRAGSTGWYVYCYGGTAEMISPKPQDWDGLIHIAAAPNHYIIISEFSLIV